MPQETQLAHRVLSNTALPYITNTSPSDTDPHYVLGSQDILTSINTYAERRPGFSINIDPNTTFVNLQRIFTWDTFDGRFFIIACDVVTGPPGIAEIWKLEVGVDTAFQRIFVDSNAFFAFDFVVSNNTLYFANGHVSGKWTPTAGVSFWGIAIGSISNATGPNSTGFSFDGGGPRPWTIGVPDHITMASVTNENVTSNNLFLTMYGFSIPISELIQGIQVIVTADETNVSDKCTLSVSMVKGGGIIGNPKPVSINPGPSPTTPTAYTLGGTSDLWGTTWTGSDINSTSFGIAVNATIRGTATTVNIIGVTITVYGLGGPIVTVSASSGTFSAVNGGYTYEYCYGNSNTGHISSPTPISNSTGNFSNKLNVSIPVVASLDPQVNQIRVFRTVDGGGGTYFELPNSPFPNTTATVTDSAPDASLQVGSIAPLPTFNDPPTPFRGMVYFSGRIWGFTGNKVWFSGLEEIVQGVPEESFPSGIAGNFWTFDEPVQALGVAGMLDSQVLAVFCGGRIYGITGNTLDTFRRFLVSNRRGCRNNNAVSAMGGMLAWLDSAGQIWATDGTQLNELSTPIRVDLSGIKQPNCSMSFHTQGRFHWLVFSTGTQLFVYDIDLDQWMPPWSFPCNCITSGEIAAGSYALLAGITKVLQMNPGSFNDNSRVYQPVLRTNLMSVVPDFGKRFSYIASGIYNEPSRTGMPWTIQVTNNGQLLKDVALCFDDDPTAATTVYNSIYPNLQTTGTAYNRNNGIALKQNVFQVTRDSSRWVGIQIKLDDADQVDKIYEIFMAYAKVGGR